MHTTILHVAVTLFLASVSVLSAADNRPVQAPRKEKAKAPAAVTAEQEAQVLQFLRQHHPELADLLGHLQASRPAEYGRAIRDIWHASERLRQVEKGDGDRYELELQSWVIQSKIQLLAARLAMADTPALRDELRGLLANQFDLRVRLAETERDRAAERLRKIDEQLKRLTDHREEILEREFLTVTKSTERLKVKRKVLLDAKSADGKPSP